MDNTSTTTIITNASSANITTTTAAAAAAAAAGVPLPARIGMVVSYAALSVIGLALYAVVVVTLWRNWKELKTTWYIINAHLAAADIGTLVTELVVGVPVTITASSVYGAVWTEILSNGSTLFFYGFFFSTLLMSVNRCLNIIFPKVNKYLFERPYIYVTMLLPWLLSCILVIVYNVTHCRKLFHTQKFIFGYFCDAGADAGQNFVNAMSVIHLVLMLSIFGIHLLIFGFLRYKAKTSSLTDGQQQSQNKISMRMLVQAFIISTCLVLRLLCVRYLPNVISDTVLRSIVNNWGLLLDSLVNPVISLTCNVMFRKLARNTVCCGKGATPVLSIDTRSGRQASKRFGASKRSGTVTMNA